MALKELSSPAIEEAHAPTGGYPTPVSDAISTAVSDVSYQWDLATDVLTWGRNLADVISIAGPESFTTGLGYAEHLSPESCSSRYEAIMTPGSCDTGGGVAFQVIYGLTPDARSGVAPIWVEDVGRWFADADSRPTRVQGVIRVVTERYETERKRAFAAQSDPVTGALNGRSFSDHIGRHLTLSGRRHTTFAVILADFAIRDDAGRPLRRPDAVDETMAIAAARIRQTMRANELLGRVDGTCLAMLLENCNGEQMAAAAGRLVCAANAESIETSVGAVSIAVRVGGVIAPLYGRTPEAILTFAGEALDIARQSAEGFVRYEPEMASNVAKKALLQATDEIIAALNEARVVIALQPIVDAKTRSTVFCEALVRIRLHDGTLLMPDVLVPAAEQGGLVALLDRRVVDLAFTRLVADPDLCLSVNASVTSLHDQQWQDHFRASCALHPGAARRLTVEITETCAVADLAATRSVLLALKALDIKIAIDDFGSGHSSFRNLRELPIDYLKIDGAFARNLAQSPDDRFFIKTLIDLARNLRIPTIAEWVEDEETAQVLTEWGIDLLQGHLFGKAEVTTSGPVAAGAMRHASL